MQFLQCHLDLLWVVNVHLNSFATQWNEMQRKFAEESMKCNQIRGVLQFTLRMAHFRFASRHRNICRIFWYSFGAHRIRVFFLFYKSFRLRSIVLGQRCLQISQVVSCSLLYSTNQQSACGQSIIQLRIFIRIHVRCLITNIVSTFK